ncbi:MAG: iron-containing alcohol dehydrogenase [Lachnospiraceae bacterium]|jgi:alcohol dehydrogenase|nr:iron-containing alcohol dehydrogenase [Lachnospiraceae bacterium]
MLKYYEFQNSAKLLAGKFALENVPGELENLGCSHPLLLSDHVLAKIGALAIVQDALLAGQVPADTLFTDIPADSSSDVVNEIARFYRKSKCDGLVAIGGGSVIDTAKGVRMLLSQDVSDIMELMGCEGIKRGRQIPFVIIPTTSGTGSESTLVAVIKDTQREVKMEFISYYLQPDVAVLDPRMTQSLPPRMTASTGMDALCHAVEAYTCLQKNPLSDAYATAAIRMIKDHIFTAVEHGRDASARLAMASASMMAGAAFSNSMVGIVHAIGHSLGAVCHVPHAEAMSILLPFCMEYNLDMLSEDYGRLLLYLTDEDTYAQTPHKERAARSIQAIRDMCSTLNRLCGLPLTLRDVNVQPEDFERVAQGAINDGAMIVNPKQAGVADVVGILKKAW